ncbi:MAG: PQQ-dependent sugar dehydrogenase, partial [Myxococcales bacterium]|nr:PQQ-dependent sugar dehydrogenase [Myxococcales bacterium]
DRPLWIGVAPGDPDTLFVVEQGGVIWAFDNRDDVADRAEFLRRAVYRNNNEEGLLGLAFHPEYAENGRFYIYYSANGGVCPAGTDRCSVLAELRRADRRRADPASERRLLVIGEPYGNHNGGDLHFGPDGLLYVGVGDGGSGGDPRGNGQNPRTLLGSILRIDVDGAAPYGIPADNPFADGVGGAPEIYTWGMRNPWRMRFDGSTGALWVGDVGQNAWEEVDKIVAPGNFGWNVREGFACYGARQCADGFEEPIWVYDHNDGLSITGGPVYRGPDLPELWGSYLFADYSSGRLWALRERPPAEPEVTQLTAGSQLTSFGEDADGRVYLTSFVGRRSILRLDRAAPPMGPEFPRLLSETGCFADTATHALAPGVVPYGVNRPLWSDGATKLRFVALPPGESARYVEDEAWQMPVGTVLIKTFLIDEAGRPEPRRLETRMYTREAQAWRGYTWRWNEDQTDAVLLDGAFDEVIDTPDGELLWHYPSRVECDQCHTAAAGFALGWRTRQLNGRFDLDGIGYDQIAALSERGYLEGAP